MTQGLLLNSGVNLVVGIALLLAWNNVRSRRFSLWLGLSFVVQAFSPPAFLVWKTGTALWDAVGFWLLVTAASTSLTLWMIGAACLAGRPIGRGRIAIGLAGMITTGAITLHYDPRLAQTFGATLTTLAAIVRAKRATTAGRQARAGENVPRTARPGLVACRWRSA